MFPLMTLKGGIFQGRFITKYTLILHSVKCFRCVFIRSAYSRTFHHNEDIKMHLTRRLGQIKTQLPQNIDVQIAIRDTRLVEP